jgi:RNA polymerase sigma-70 factor (ECF subfamily)
MNNVQLSQRYAVGDEGAFQELVHQYQDSVYAFLRTLLNDRDLVDDVFQGTFLQLYVSRDRFDLSKPLRPWLFTIAANKAKDALRHRQRTHCAHLGNALDRENEKDSLENLLDTLDCDEHLPCDDLIQDETAAAVQRAIARMPAKLREILILAYYQKIPYAELSDILHIPLGTVKSRLHTAVCRFAEEWNAVAPYETANERLLGRCA